MAGTSENVRIWSEIDFWVAPEGTEFPTDLVDTDAFDPAFEPVGYLDQEDAVAREFSSDDTDHWALGNRFVRKTSVKSKETINFTALENSHLVYQLQRPGSEASTDGEVTTRVNRPRNIGLGNWAVIIDRRDGEVRELECIPRGLIMGGGSLQEGDTDMAGKPLTLEQLAVEDEGGETFYSTVITNDPSAAVTGS